MWNPWGTYADLTTACENDLVLVPNNLTMQEAAGIPLVSITAYMALDACGIENIGKKLLIQGGAGRCGTMCIQLAKLRGFEVTVTCSGHNIDFVKSFGADYAIDYKSEKFWEGNNRYDAVIDFVGGDAETNSLKVLRREGTFVSVLSSRSIFRIIWQAGIQKTKSLLGLGPAYRIIMVHPDGKILQNIADYLQAGMIRPVIDKIMSLEDAAAAHEYMDQGKNSRGKVILTVR
jgi:alcohol dehydrogenase